MTLHGAGSTFSAPLYKKWIEVYQRDHAQVSLIYDAVGSGEGVTRFTAGSIDFGATDVLPGDVVLAGAKGGAIPVPVTAGMIVLAYNLPGLAGALKLPRDVYSGIFSGKITQWNDPAIQKANPGLALPKKDIAVVVRQDSSGTTAAFTRHLVVIGSGWHATGSGEGYDIDWPAAAMDGRGNEGVSSKIKISDGSIGYVEYGFAKMILDCRWRPLRTAPAVSSRRPKTPGGRRWRRRRIFSPLTRRETRPIRSQPLAGCFSAKNTRIKRERTR